MRCLHLPAGQPFPMDKRSWGTGCCGQKKDSTLCPLSLVMPTHTSSLETTLHPDFKLRKALDLYWGCGIGACVAKSASCNQRLERPLTRIAGHSWSWTSDRSRQLASAFCSACTLLHRQLLLYKVPPSPLPRPQAPAQVESYGICFTFDDRN